MRLDLEPDMISLAEAGDEASALALADSLQPDVVLVDEMAGVDGLKTVIALRQLAPNTAVVLLSLHEDAATRLRAILAGAAAVVSKRRGPDELIEAIRRAALSSSKQVDGKHERATD